MEQENENSQFINKKYFALSMLFIVTLIFIMFFSTYILLSNKINDIKSDINLSAAPTFNETKEPDSEKITYTLKEYNGKLGVYKNNDFQYEVDIYVFTLPENDKKLLSQGINVSSEQELNDIISSYY